jgi:hypothetical protein
MFSLPRFASLTIFVGIGALFASAGAQEPPRIVASTQGDVPPVVDVPNVPKGVEVLARGPVHEAFATPSTEPRATQLVPKKPPENIEEMPPEEKPDGDVVWIGGYWSWDDDRQDFLWVSGCWRMKPQDKEWAPGYWREQSGQWQWVPGFWTTVQETQRPEVTYYPEPPPPPQLAPPGNPPEADMFYVPGYWMWVGNHYVWRAGYFTRVRPGHVYISSHYRWTPHGYVFVSGYWDYAIARRGVLYAPVVVDTVVIGPRFVFTPYYAVTDTIVVDALFVRPGFCHYYFGDYYGPRYATLGFECGFHYSRRCYDPIITYSRWEYRDTPGWFDVHLSISLGRSAGHHPCPPRTLVQQVNVVNNVTVNKTVINNTTVKNNNVVLAPAKNVMAAKGVKSVALDASARARERDSADAVRTTVTKQRQHSELVAPGTTPANKPRTANLDLPANRPGKKAPALRAADNAKVTGPGLPVSADVQKKPKLTTAHDDGDDRGNPKSKARPVVDSGKTSAEPRVKTAAPAPATPPPSINRPPATTRPSQPPPPPPRKSNDEKKKRS